METILVLGDLNEAAGDIKFLINLAQRNNVRVVEMTREEYDSVTAACEDGVRRDLKSDGIDLTEGDWNDEATRRLDVRLCEYLASEHDLVPSMISATIIIPSKDYPIDWWPFDGMTREQALVTTSNA